MLSAPHTCTGVVIPVISLLSALPEGYDSVFQTVLPQCGWKSTAVSRSLVIVVLKEMDLFSAFPVFVLSKVTSQWYSPAPIACVWERDTVTLFSKGG